MTKGQGKSSIAPTFSKRGYNNFLLNELHRLIHMEQSGIHKRSAIYRMLTLSLQQPGSFSFKCSLCWPKCQDYW